MSSQPASPATATATMTAPHAHGALDVVEAMGSDPASGLSGAEAESRLSRDGANEITAEKPEAPRGAPSGG